MCYSGWQLKNRGGPDSSGWTMVSPDKKFKCSGAITMWRWRAKRNSNPFRAIVWRPVGGSDTKFKIVGINNIPAQKGKVGTYLVPKFEQIKAQVGDVIGWSFGRSTLTYNGGGRARVRWVGGSLHTGLEVGQEVNIRGGVGKREYSIEAAINTCEGKLNSLQICFCFVLFLFLFCLVFALTMSHFKGAVSALSGTLWFASSK